MGQSLKKHPGGRPTKYSRQVLDTTMDYLQNYESYGDVVPTKAGLAKILDCDRETINVWGESDDKPEFSRMYRKLMAYQEHSLVNNGLTGKYNSNVTKLMLSKHGYSDTDKTDSQIVININRDTTTLETKGQTLTIDHDTAD